MSRLYEKQELTLDKRPLCHLLSLIPCIYLYKKPSVC
jgi:hypothetical protein